MSKQSFLKLGFILTGLFFLLQNTFAQEDSLVENYNAETLWYLQKETWMVGLILFIIIISGFFYRTSKVSKRNFKNKDAETPEASASDKKLD